MMRQTISLSILLGVYLPLAAAIAACVPGLKPLPGQSAVLPPWGEIVEQRRELWPICYLLPGGAYVR